MPVAGSRTSLHSSELVLPAADLGRENPLPPLVSLQEIHDVENIDELPAELADGIRYGRLPCALPYLLQDDYRRDRAPRTLQTLVLENSRLRATVLPGLGGRLYSLWHKETKCELLFSNPVFQPANLALRNAWFAGGVEWNLGSIGHTTLTCAPMHASTVTGQADTYMLRLWEWERTRDLVYQLDFWLPDDSEFLFVGVRVRNPHAHDVPVYWWSNIAVPQTPNTRVIVPADEAWRFGYSGRLERVPVPDSGGLDVSYSMRHRDAADFFFELPAGQRPWIAVVDGAGRGLVQVSTGRLRGRKLFVWGEGRGGRRWQEWLAPGVGGHGYLEIQAGLARTQLEHLRLPGGTGWDWLEAYGPLSVEPGAAHGGRWSDAVSAAGAALDAALPAERLADRFTAWRSVADVEPRARLHRGSGWGALELARARRSGAHLALPGTPFDAADLAAEHRPWLDLLEGAMPVAEVDTPPGATLVSAPWLALLAGASDADGNWLTSYHLGVARWSAGEREQAVAAWRRSLEQKVSPWAMRNVAVADLLAGRVEGAVEQLSAAARLAPGVPALVVETITALLAAGRAEDAAAMVGAARGRWPAGGRLALLDARARLMRGDLAGAQRIFDEGFEIADLREGERGLTETWWAIQERRVAGAGPVDDAARARARAEHPLPAAYDFTMISVDECVA